MLLKQVTREERVKAVLSCIMIELIVSTLFLYYIFSLLNVDNHVVVKAFQIMAIFLAPVIMVVTFVEARRQWIRASKELELLDLLLKINDFDE